MFYEIAGKNYEFGGNVTTEQMLKDIIETDQLSQAKVEMTEGTRYYNTQNDILQRDFREFYVDNVKYVDYNKSNDHIPNNLFKTLIDQKQGYITNKPLQFELKNKDGDMELIEKVNAVVGENFQSTVADWVASAAIKGHEEIQPFLNADGVFDYCLIPGEQVIYITDTTYQKNVEQAIRYYVMEIVENGDTIERKRVEIWDKEKVTRYQEIDDGYGNTIYQFITPGTYGVDINPQYHWYTYSTNSVDDSQLTEFNDVSREGIEVHGWNRVPMITLLNNSNKRSDLVPIKKYVDALDVVASGFLNDLKDIQLAIWVLKGYEGADLGEFMFNLMKFKAMKLDADGNSGAEPKTMEIPKEARSAMMEWLEKKIYEVGQGVNVTNITGGSITNVVIKAMYSGLDIKCGQMINKLKTAISEFMYFVVEYINDRDGTAYDYNDVTVKFNTSMLFNQKEAVETKNLAIDAAIKLKNSLVSHETALKILGKMVEDIEFNVEDEISKYEKEQEARLSAFDNNMGFSEVE